MRLPRTASGARNGIGEHFTPTLILPPQGGGDVVSYSSPQGGGDIRIEIAMTEKE